MTRAAQTEKGETPVRELPAIRAYKKLLYRQARCVKCVGSYLTKGNCNRKIRLEQVKCAMTIILLTIKTMLSISKYNTKNKISIIVIKGEF